MSFWDQPEAPTAEAPEPDPVVLRPAPKLLKLDALYEFFKRQGIDAETVDAFSCGISAHEFGTLGKRPAICFPFAGREGESLGYGYRPPEGQPREWDQPAAGALFNIHAVETWDAIWWCADELEVMALASVGFRQAVAAPCDLDTALRDTADVLGDVKQVTLALPASPAGNELRDVLAGRLGRHRVWTVDWPDGCTCACDVLRQHGPDRLQQVIHAAMPWPVEGVQYVQAGLLTKLRRMKPPKVMTTGTRATDAVMRFPGEGKLVIVTGLPGGGKTTYMRFVMVHTAKDEGRKWLCFSPENAPWERFVAECAEVYIGKPFHRRRLANGDVVNAMSDAELTEAETWLRPRVQMLVSDSVDVAPSLDWILDRAKACALRDGITDVLIDPWNEVEHSRPERMTETEYVGLSLQRINAFCARHSVNVWVIAHPKVPDMPKHGKIQAPGLYSISGGANWANKAALGLCVHTPDNEFTQVIVLKSKFRRWGTKGRKALISFDPTNNRYFSTASQAELGDSVEQDQ